MKHRKLASLGAVIFLCVSGVGCRSKTLSDSTILAEVGDTQITVGDFNLERQRASSVEKNMAPDIFLQSLIQKRIIVLLAKKEGLANSPEYSQVPDAEKDRWLIQSYITHLSQSISDNEILQYYKSNPRDFPPGTQTATSPAVRQDIVMRILARKSRSAVEEGQRSIPIKINQSSLALLSGNGEKMDTRELVRIDDVVITVADYRAFVNKSPHIRRQPPSVILNALIQMKVIGILAKRAGLASSPEYQAIPDANKDSWLDNEYMKRYFPAGHRPTQAQIKNFNKDFSKAMRSMKIKINRQLVNSI